jgi:hypothetical protein
LAEIALIDPAVGSSGRECREFHGAQSTLHAPRENATVFQTTVGAPLIGGHFGVDRGEAAGVQVRGNAQELDPALRTARERRE